MHAALVPSHAVERPLIGMLFAASALVLAAGSVPVDRSERRAVVVAAGLLLGGLLALYAVSRMVVVWPLAHVEPVDAVGVVAKLLEAAGLTLAVSLLRVASGSDEALRAEREGNQSRLARVLSSAAFMALRLGEEDAAKQFVERAIPLTRRLDDLFQWMIFQIPLAHAALLTGDTDTAERALREQLILARKLVLPLVAEGLTGLAAIAAVRGDPDRAARLIGAAQTHQYGNQPDRSSLTRLTRDSSRPPAPGAG